MHRSFGPSGIVCLLLSLAACLCNAQPASNAAWPESLGNSLNAGTYSGSGGTGQLRWSLTDIASTDITGSAIVGANNTIYISDENGAVQAIDGASGTRKWTYDLVSYGGGGCSTAPALGSNGLLYVGDTGGTLWALSAATGKVVWYCQTFETIVTSPTIGPDGTIYFATSNGILFAIDPATHAKKWSFEGYPNPVGSAAVTSDGNVYFCAGDWLFAINAFTGLQEWVYTEPNQDTFDCSPVVGPDGTIYLESSHYHVIAVGPNGNQLWLYNKVSPLNLLGSVCVDGQEVIFGDGDTLTAISTSGGSPLWTFGAVDSINTTPMVEYSGNIVACDTNGDVFAVDPKHGHSIWYYTVSQLNPPTQVTPSQMAMGYDGALYFAANSDHIYALDGAHITKAYTTPTAVVGGQGMNGVVQINEPAGPGGEAIALFNGNADVSMPGQVYIQPGQTGVSFAITTSPVSVSESDIFIASTAGDGPAMTVGFNVDTPAISKYYVQPVQVVGGTTTYGVVQLAGPAGPNGDVVTLDADTACTPPASVTVPAGSTGVSFPITTNAVSKSVGLNLSAILGSSTVYGVIYVDEAPISNFYVKPSTITGSLSTSGVVQINGPAGPNGDVISLQSNSSTVKVPASVTIPATLTGVSFPIASSTVTASTMVTLTATGSNTVQATLTVNPYSISNFFAQPSTIVGGTGTHCVVQISGKAGPGGELVTLQSNNSDVVVPASVKVAEGTSGVSFAVSSWSVTSTTQVTVTATLGSSSKTATITLTP